MTAVPIERTAEDELVGSLLDWDYWPPCEVKRGQKQCDRPADWIITWRNPLPCGTEVGSLTSLVCNPCLDEFRTHGVSCPFCHSHWTLGRVVDRIRPLRRGDGADE